MTRSKGRHCAPVDVHCERCNKVIVHSATLGWVVPSGDGLDRLWCVEYIHKGSPYRPQHRPADPREVA